MVVNPLTWLEEVEDWLTDVSTWPSPMYMNEKWQLNTWLTPLNSPIKIPWKKTTTPDVGSGGLSGFYWQQDMLGNWWKGTSTDTLSEVLDKKERQRFLKESKEFKKLPDSAYFVNEKWDEVQKLMKKWESKEDYNTRVWIPEKISETPWETTETTGRTEINTDISNWKWFNPNGKSLWEEVKTEIQQTTGIAEIDTAISDLRNQKDQSISDTIKNYNINKWLFEEKKNLFTNYDDVNSSFEGVLWDLETIQKGGLNPTEQDYQNIANKYGVTIEEVMNPTTILDKLTLSDEGKVETGVTDFEKNITNLTTNFENQKSDLNRNLEIQKQNTANQIDDTQEQLNRTTQSMVKSWVWSGANRSSGYQQGIENIKQDSQKTMTRMQQALNNIEGATATNIERLTATYNDSVDNAKNQLDNQLEQVKYNLWLDLNWLEDKYWAGTKELQNALKAINEEFWTQSMEVFSQYVTNMKSIQDLTNSELENEITRDNLLRTQADRRYNELVANNGALLINSTVDNLMEEYAQGNITLQRFQDLQNVMTNGITNVLSQVGNIDSADMVQIKEKLASWLTPTEVIWEMSQLEKFKDVEDSTTQDWSKFDDNRLYNERTGEFKNVTTWETTSEDISDVDSVVDFSQNKRGREELQCGELVNDYIYKSTWVDPTGAGRMQDTLESKVDALTSIWVSDTPIAGWVFVSNPLWNDIWHTGIVQKVNPDGSIEVLEANAWGSDKWEVPVLKKYSAEDIQNMSFSVNPNQEAIDKKEAEDEQFFKTDSISQFSNYLSNGKIWNSATEIETIENEFGSIEEFKRQAENYNNSANWPKAKEIAKIKDLRDTVAWFLSEENEWAVDDTTWFIKTAATPNAALRKNAFLWEIQNFLNKNTLQNLIDAKAEGATFGALSNEELRLLQTAANKVSSLALYDNPDDKTQITWFKWGTDNFRKELQWVLNQYDKKIRQKESEMNKWVIFTDEDWVEYKTEGDLLKQIEKQQLEDPNLTDEKVYDYLEQNNLLYILD